MRKVWFSSATVALVCLLLEVVGLGLFRLTQGRTFSYGVLGSNRVDALDGQGGRFVVQGSPGAEVVHPYLGFVMNPRGDSDEARQYNAWIAECCRLGVNDFGFLDDKEPIQPADPKRVIVGLLGGSVAFWLSARAPDVLVAELERARGFQGREIVLVRLALGGFKQPQQLQTLSYLLALGAHFDAVINVDGFNEVALPVAENLPQHVFPFFPRNWFHRAQTVPDHALLKAIAAATRLHDRRRRAIRFLAETPARYSAFATLVWVYYDRLLSNRLFALQRAEQATGPRGAYQITGPRWQPEGSSDLYGSLVRVWKSSSMQLHRLATANGISYFHVLQPNQYVEGSKPMGARERAIAYRATQPYRDGVIGGYAGLRHAGQELAAAGVNFLDMTEVFASVTDQLYIDDCCHFNEQGNQILAAAIGRAIVQRLDEDHR